MQQTPDICIDSNNKYVYSTTSVLFFNVTEKVTAGAIAQLSLVNGDVRWFKRDLAVNGMGPLACLPDGAGVMGCASYAATSHVFKVKENGNVDFNYMFTGDNPETCLGIR